MAQEKEITSEMIKAGAEALALHYGEAGEEALKPVPGEVNFKVLRQQIMSRFPKTLAYLAK